MIIEKLTINNWMIFKGNQTISFPHNTANVTIIFGENMHGKTSLLNSIRWALYGEALNRQSKAINKNDLINKDAKIEGETNVSVKLIMKADEKRYELTRSMEFETGAIKDQISLRIDSRVVDGGEIDKEVNNLIPKQISQFFLFDGELLKQFEELVVAVDSTQATAIKNAIEQSLGIPLLIRAEAELRGLSRTLSKERNAELNKNKAVKLLTEKLEELESDLSIKEDESETIKTLIKEAKESIAELRIKLDESEEAIKYIEKEKLLQTTLEDNRQTIDTYNNDKQILVKSFYLIPLQAAIKPVIDSLEAKLGELSATKSQIITVNIQIKQLENSLLTTECEVCGLGLTKGSKLKIQNEIDNLKNNIDSTDLIDKEIFRITNDLNTIRFEVNDPLVIHKSDLLTDQINKLEYDNTTIENELFDIKELLKGVDKKTSLSIREEYDVRHQELGSLETNLESTENKIREIEIDIKEIKRNPAFKSGVTASPVIQKSDLTDNLKDIFKDTISAYRNKMREKIESRATHTFSILTTEEQFDKLEINENYGLDLIIAKQKILRSAGAEQIVAISLIEALNYLGRRKGPMFMDTPAGRLDITHRKNIMNHLPTVVTQLALFAHSGELQENNIYFDKSLIGKRYKLNRISTFNSQIIEA